MAARKKMSDLGRSRHNAGICEETLEGLAKAIQNLLNEGKTENALLQLKKCISARKADSRKFNSITSEGANSKRDSHKHVILRVEGLKQKIIDNSQLLTTVGGTVKIEYDGYGYLKISYKPINSEVYAELKKIKPTPHLYPTRKATMNPLLKPNKNSTSNKPNGTRRKISPKSK